MEEELSIEAAEDGGVILSDTGGVEETGQEERQLLPVAKLLETSMGIGRGEQARCSRTSWSEEEFEGKITCESVLD